MDGVDQVLGVLGEVWARATAVGPVPDRWLVLVTGGVVLLGIAVRPVWHVLRHALTVVHEAGHGLVALLAGRRLSGIRLHSDTSGLTVSVGRPRGPGMVATLFAGYPAPAVVGLGLAWLVLQGRSAAALWLALLVTVLVLLQIRNGYGFLVLVLGVAGLGAVTWWVPPDGQAVVACVVAWLMLLGAPRAVLEMASQRRRERRTGRRSTSDADQLAGITPPPAVLWTAALMLVCVACLLIGGAWLLVPAT